MVELAEGEREILLVGGDLMTRLVACDDWLPAVFAQADAAQCRHYLLYGDGLERFCVVAAVYAGGQASPIRRNGAWEIFGVLRGALERRRFAWTPGAPPRPDGEAERLAAGAVGVVSARAVQAVRTANGLAGHVSIAIHVHGGGAEQWAGQAAGPDGAPCAYLSGYANPEHAPAYDIWSIQTRIED